MSYNGGVVVAMKGDGCVAIAADRRLGVRGHTVSMDFKKVFGESIYVYRHIRCLLLPLEMGPTLFVGLPGLATDTITVHQRLRFRLNLYELRENRRINPNTFASVVSNILYEKRFGPYFVEPVIAGLGKTCCIHPSIAIAMVSNRC